MAIVRERQPGEPLIISNGEPEIFCAARIGAIVRFPVLEDHGQGYEERIFERYARAPGTRIIALRDNKIYLQQERRTEVSGEVATNGELVYGWDWRLPGGKVIDSFAEYKQYLGKPIPAQIILDAAKKELREEAKLEAGAVRLFDKKVCGTTVEWDLYYIIAEDVHDVELTSHNNEGEEIQSSQWFSYDEVRRMCERGDIDEGRSVAALIKFLAQA